MKKVSLSKILFSVIILGLFAVSSCKKDGGNNSSNYYVKFKLDGTDKEYSKTTVAVFTTALPVYSCAMIGETLISGTVFEGMGITIYSDAAIAANVTYTDAVVASIGTPAASLLYTDATGAQSTSALGGSPNVKVVITSLDANSITGTFSGTIVSTIDLTTAQVVTEGQFHLPRQ